ncbi:MAG: branched-chain amino acid ABC transporter permease [Spirochaetales bacterium]|jgi:branched-chain amino acid transport system permease protein|nr:branched-chain amino acid ABC transporter permease [Spirochaetales bacterium]
MAIFIQQLCNGLALGLVYALVAVGYSLVFGILRLINFSHGAVYAFGAHAAFFFVGLNFGPVPAIIAALVITGLLGVVIDKTALAPLRKKRSVPIAALVTTLGISNIIQNLLVVKFGSQRKPFPDFFNLGAFTLGGIQFSSRQFVMFGVSLVLLLLLLLVVNKTKIGLAMRATAQNAKAASLMGINVNSIITLTFLMGGASAAIAGGMVGGYYQVVYPGMGFMIGLKAFAASVLGGIGSLPGALVGGLLVGVIESIAALYIGSNYRDSMAFIILIVVLIVRPAGLFGKNEVVKV